MSGADLTAIVEDLQARVRELEDKQEIRELVARYNHTFDDQDAEGFADTYVPEGRMVHPRDGHEHGGREAFLASCKQFGGQVVHMTTDPEIAIDGDTATHRATMAIYFRSADGARVRFVHTGTYRDDLRRTPEGWRFVTRRAERDQREVRLIDLVEADRSGAPS